MDEILEGAVIALEEVGADFTMDYLAKRIRVSKRTIYEKYRSKEEIISLVFYHKVREISKRHEKIFLNQELSIEEKLLEFLTPNSRFFHMIETEEVRKIIKNYPSVLEKSSEQVEKDWNLLSAFLRGEIQKGRVKPMDVDVFVYIFMSLQITLIERTDKTFEEMRYIIKEVLHQLVFGIMI